MGNARQRVRSDGLRPNGEERGRVYLARVATLADWAGCCDQVVEALLRVRPTLGARRDGVWTGPAASWGWRSDRWRRDSRGFPIHVWIESLDGTVVDPMRWMFEGVWPYVYEGPSDCYAEAIP